MQQMMEGFVFIVDTPPRLKTDCCAQFILSFSPTRLKDISDLQEAC